MRAPGCPHNHTSPYSQQMNQGTSHHFNPYFKAKQAAADAIPPIPNPLELENMFQQMIPSLIPPLEMIARHVVGDAKKAMDSLISHVIPKYTDAVDKNAKGEKTQIPLVPDINGVMQYTVLEPRKYLEIATEDMRRAGKTWTHVRAVAQEILANTVTYLDRLLQELRTQAVIYRAILPRLQNIRDKAVSASNAICHIASDYPQLYDYRYHRDIMQSDPHMKNATNVVLKTHIRTDDGQEPRDANGQILTKQIPMAVFRATATKVIDQFESNIAANMTSFLTESTDVYNGLKRLYDEHQATTASRIEQLRVAKVLIPTEYDPCDADFDGRSSPAYSPVSPTHDDESQEEEEPPTEHRASSPTFAPPSSLECDNAVFPEDPPCSVVTVPVEIIDKPPIKPLRFDAVRVYTPELKAPPKSFRSKRPAALAVRFYQTPDDSMKHCSNPTCDVESLPTTKRKEPPSSKGGRNAGTIPKK